MQDIPYTAREELHAGARTILLTDETSGQSARILMYGGNTLMQYTAGETEFIHFPEAPAEYLRSGNLQGNPFLFPWANRLRGDYYHFAGKRYELSQDVYRDGNGLPIHGLVIKSEAWQPIALDADEQGARYTARLDPANAPRTALNFPFPHYVDVTHRLKGGRLTVSTELCNTGSAPIPACFGHHPYFALGRSRADPRLRIPADAYLKLDDQLLPTGESEAVKNTSYEYSPAKEPLDRIFTTLRRESDGMAWFRLETEERGLQVAFDAHYTIAIVYAPRGQPFVCIEPMTAPTDALNMNHQGTWPALMTVEPGESLKAEFIIVPEPR